MRALPSFFFFFFNDTATTEIYTLSLHDALPICQRDDAGDGRKQHGAEADRVDVVEMRALELDRKSTRLNSSHQIISYAVFCLKKKKKNRRARDKYTYFDSIRQLLTCKPIHRYDD